MNGIAQTDTYSIGKITSYTSIFEQVRGRSDFRKFNSKEEFVLRPSHKQAEIVLNLWAYSDEEGYVQRLAGKCYALHGSDTEKLAVLRALAKSDFLSARWEPVPKNYGLVNADGTEILGVATTNEVLDQHASAQLFQSLIDRLEAELPEQVQYVNGGYKTLKLAIPQEPLMIMTVVIEQSDGNLVPVLRALEGAPQP